MRAYLWLAVLAIFLLLPPGVPGKSPGKDGDYSINQLSMVVDLGGREENFKLNITSNSPALKYFDFYYSSPIEVFSNGESLSVEERGKRKRIFFQDPLKEGEEKSFTIESRKELEIKEGDYFFKSFSTPKNISHFQMRVVFPRDNPPQINTFNQTVPNCCTSTIYQKATSLPPDGITIKEGRVALIWEGSLEAGEKFEVGINLPEKEESPSYALISGGLAAALAAAFAFVMGIVYSRRRHRGEMAEIFLNQEEQKVVDLIRASGGEILQENIWKDGNTPFSRPKVSRIIADLESKGVVQKKPYKKTFKVKLTI